AGGDAGQGVEVLRRDGHTEQVAHLVALLAGGAATEAVDVVLDDGVVQAGLHQRAVRADRLGPSDHACVPTAGRRGRRAGGRLLDQRVLEEVLGGDTGWGRG